MGQYYKPLVLDKEGHRLYVYNPRNFDSGLKLMEHSWIFNPCVNAVMKLIEEAPKRIAWIGDYSQDVKELQEKIMPEQAKTFQDYYDLVRGKTAIDDDYPEELQEELVEYLYTHENIKDPLHTDEKYLINHSQKIYFNLNEYVLASIEKDDVWCLHPLSLLTACGNGLGGGDYYDNNINVNDIGTWAFDLIEYSKQEPSGYEKHLYQFQH